MKRFLEMSFGDKFHVVNLCPRCENEYPASEFGGRVARFPFPSVGPTPLHMVMAMRRVSHTELMRGATRSQRSPPAAIELDPGLYGLGDEVDGRRRRAPARHPLQGPSDRLRAHHICYGISVKTVC